MTRTSSADRRSLVPLIAAGMLVASGPGAMAQDTVPTPSTEISGFRGVEWGTPATQIIAALGEPIEERRLERGLRILAYRDTLAGQPSIVMFGVLDNKGLVKGQEIVDSTRGEECIELIRDIHRQVNLRYPLIRPAARAKNNSRDAICEAARQGLAFWHRQWRDEATGSVITVSLNSGADQIDLIYESRAFREWVAPDSAAATLPPLEDEAVPSEILAPAQ